MTTLAFAEPTTDAPYEFHIAGGLVLAATVAGRSIWLDRGHGSLYPNIWALLLAKSSFYRKSTCISLVEQILRQHHDGRYLLPEESTPESFIDILAESPHGLLRWKEFATLLGQLDRKYMHGFKEFLTEAFDCPAVYVRQTRGGGEVTVEEPCISIFSASTLDWLIQQLSAPDVRGGFLSRFVYLAPVSKHKRLPFPEKAGDKAAGKVLRELELLEGFAGEMSLNKYAREHYKAWSLSLEEELDGAEHGELLSSFYTRLADYVLKFAMLYAATADRSHRITKKRLTQAINAAEYFKSTVHRLVTQEFTFSRFELRRKQVVRILERNNGTCPYSMVLKNSHLLAHELRLILKTMEADGTIQWDGGKCVSFAKNRTDSQDDGES